MQLDEILHSEELSKDEIVFLLNLTKECEKKKLFKRADEIRAQYCEDEIHLRGIIEFSNYCAQNCLYCGSRKDNYILPRYRMTPEEIIEAAKTVSKLGIFTIILQSGEDMYYDTDLIAYMVYQIKQHADISIILCLGERGYDEYRAWKYAGADGYLLKHETANENLYSVYHKQQRLEERLNHLRFMKSLGYKIGSGNIIGLPMQTLEDLADDLLLCKNLSVDMATFCRFNPSANTPYSDQKKGNVELTLKMLSVARLVLKDVQIQATTDLASMEDEALIQGLNVGANVIMPDMTPISYREKYQISSTGISADDNPLTCKSNLEKQVESIGRKISNKRGDVLKQNITNT